MEARGHAIENTQGNWISGVAQDFDPSNIPETRWCKGKTKTFGMRAIFGQSSPFLLSHLISNSEQLYSRVAVKTQGYEFLQVMIPNHCNC